MATTLQMQQNALIRGTSVWLRVGKTANNVKTVGFCDSFRGSKNLQLQRAQVTGSIIPVSIDPQGVSVQISVSGFIPTKKVMESNANINGKEKDSVSIVIFNPDEYSYIEKEQITKIPYMEFYDKNSDTIVAYFTDVIVSQFTVSVNGGSYVKGDLSMEAISMGSGADFTRKTLEESLS